MLDWKNRAGSAGDRADASSSSSSVKKTRSYFGNLVFSKAVGIVVGVYLIVTLLIGWYWSHEPALFPVQQNAQAAAEREGKQMVVGFTTVETLKTIVSTLLDKRGGYISNDRFPPGLWLDNIPSWEYGVLVQVRDMTRALRKDFSRSQSQRLSASVGRVKLNSALKTEAQGPLKPGEVPQVDEEVVETPWLQIDNVFYEARGQAWALSLLLRAVEVDFADVLAKKNATVSVRQIIRELEASQEPLWSPMVLNGSPFGILANHSLVMANYISRANAAVIDLRQLLSQG
jgi:hypothetical protein